MPTIYQLKPAFQNLLRPLAQNLFRRGITANDVTLVAMLLSGVVGALLFYFPRARWALFLIPLFLLIRMALNAIDGLLAREHNQKSALGALLNELGDVVSDVALYLPFAVLPGIEPKLLVLTVLLAVMSEMAGVVAIQIGASRRYDGPMGKSDRALVFGVVALALALGAPPAAWQNWVFAAVAVLLLLTIFNRARGALQEV